MEENYETQSIKPIFNPQAIVDYYYNSDEKGKRKGLKDVLMKAKQHLSAVGWSFHYIYKKKCGRREPRYCPPNAKKKYCSLRTACKAYIDKQAQLGETTNHALQPKLIRETNIEDPTKSKKRKLCFVDHHERMLRFIKGARNMVEEVDVNLVPSYSSMRPKVGEFWIDLFEDGDGDGDVDGEQMNVATDLKKSSVDDTGRKDCKLAEGVKKRNIGGKNMKVLGDLKKSSVDDLFLSGGKDCKLVKGVNKRKIGGKGGLRGVNNGIVTQNLREYQNDDVCSICRDGGDLILCDQCPSAFHAHCLGLSGVPASEFWYCQSCCCGICGQNICRDDSHIPNKQCDQCEKQYHVKCIGECYVAKLERKKWFCSQKCLDISSGLDHLLGKPIAVGGNNLTWTLLKNNKNVNDPQTNRKLKRVLAVMHECFESVKEPWGGRDVGEDVIFSRKSELKQLDFRGFYTVILQKGNRVVTFATVRVFGDKVAEVPFIATRFKYRRQGMCKTLMNVLEEKLINLGVEKLVLPAMISVLETWTSPSFAFSEMTANDRSMLMDYTFLEFPGTVACQKLLLRSDDNL